MNNNWEFDYTNLHNNAGQPTGQATGPIEPEVIPAEQSGSPRHNKGLGKRVASGALALVLCGAVGFGGGYLGGKASNNGSRTVIYQAASVTESTGTASNGDALTLAEIAAKVSPSVVEVTTETVSTSQFFQNYVQDGAGSGVILTEDGYIITNNHVVSGANHITVTLSDKTQYEATVIGTDSKTDVAVLKIDATGLTPAVIGDSDALQVGETTVAVGNPLGTLGGTVTNGIISALNRDITINNDTMTLLQTNAAVSPGNSGGGLFNSRGELIGIVNAKSSGSDTEGLGFAIPVNTAISVAESLMTNGYVTGRPAMGVTVIGISDLQTAMQYGVSQLGVYVQSVESGSAAEAAGLQPGDLFVSINGTAISETSDITGLLSNCAVGDTLEVQVVRGKQIVATTITLQESKPTTTTND